VNINKAVIATIFVAASVAAQAQLTLAAVSFKLGAGFSSLVATPSYNDALGTANVSLSTPSTIRLGTVNSWVFTAVDTANIGDLSYDITLNHISAGTTMFATLTAYSYNPLHPSQIGSEYGIGFVDLGTVDSYTSLSSGTQTIDLGYNLSSFHTKDAEYKLNVTFANAVPEPSGIAATGLGVLGLVIRRRRRSL
jgi:hypothetical protein